VNISRILRLRGLGQGAQADMEMESTPHIATVTFYSCNEDEYGEVTARSNPHGELVGIPRVTCAVDPRIIPYGSWIVIPDLASFSADGDGRFFACDTGSAVVARTASLRRGSAYPVIDCYVGDVDQSELSRLQDKYGGSREYYIV
jgi:3D (Asp-Asp-Asp) domain-containing protein